ncbi:hypothetical protein E2C01_067030 [Portunus trituberculatus]|uniref:Uncharacterized protein n=1 Tax=Portunus trituberculatus TaxID=210409 RepID=A0A5B7HVH5_PORTR|nr:hypothetical protein [Portunus trituberculatus]
MKLNDGGEEKAHIVAISHTGPRGCVFEVFNLTSPHLTLPHLTSPHLTSPHLTSRHLTLLYQTPALLILSDLSLPYN